MYEYKVEMCNGHDVVVKGLAEKKLNEMTVAGWEYFNTEVINVNVGHYSHLLLFFRREKK